MLLEIAWDQAKPALELASRHDRFTGARIVKDAAGNDRVLSVSLVS